MHDRDNARPYPTRSPYVVEWDEGPQTIAEMKTALTPWPEALQSFVKELESTPFTSAGEEPLTRIRQVLVEHRVIWLSLVHPVIEEAERASQDGTATTYTLDEVMTDYDPVTYERRDGGDRT
ncbi:hypothetical protein GT204_17700 [Streptomyces sp. SID4919]|uniref:hypothetical protein n=1 Tax=unclassified Streptomyces TaxID=2593676 RepID=UPI000823F734|nr:MULTISPECIES: hypothetical protein [unclassified Streptomyces]MYY10696.1 hypothetical protein [Streptomyces sp. SID4919]SCK62319.1 hypothetical protein YW7DRAFT_06574 [Streptomyces sp. AmelKG-E11A]